MAAVRNLQANGLSHHVRMTVDFNHFNLAAGPPVCVGMFLMIYYKVKWSTIVHHDAHG